MCISRDSVQTGTPSSGKLFASKWNVLYRIGF